MSCAAEWRFSKSHDCVGGMVAYEVLGAGPPVVLAHGTPSWSYLRRSPSISGSAVGRIPMRSGLSPSSSASIAAKREGELGRREPAATASGTVQA
jgi:hypothetical protein